MGLIKGRHEELIPEEILKQAKERGLPMPDWYGPSAEGESVRQNDTDPEQTPPTSEPEDETD